MIQLTPIENDDKKMFHQIALNKTTKNSQCLTCQRDKKYVIYANWEIEEECLGWKHTSLKDMTYI